MKRTSVGWWILGGEGGVDGAQARQRILWLWMYILGTANATEHGYSATRFQRVSAGEQGTSC